MTTDNIQRAKQGLAIDWTLAKQEFIDRLRDILTGWNTDPTEYTDQIDAFKGPPHTVQRLAELLDEPGRWYSTSEKYTRALSRVLNVSSTVADFSRDKEEQVFTEESLLVPIPWLVDTDDPRTSAA